MIFDNGRRIAGRFVLGLAAACHSGAMRSIEPGIHFTAENAA